MFVIVKMFMIILAIIGTAFLLPVGTALYLGEYDVIRAFIIPLAISWVLGGIFYFIRPKKSVLSTRSVFVFVSASWIVISIFGALPLYFGNYIPSFVDAVFESVSGFSTTGSTILSDIEALPRSINLWRCETHWLGGMGIIALTAAILPIIGVGGFQLVKAESTGPEKGKITPKMANTAKALWLLYFTFTIAQFILLMFCGMDWIDALSHAFSTLGTGGFSTKNASLAGFNNLSVEIVCTVFMFLASINFSLYFYVITGKFREISRNSEFKAYLGIFFVVVLCLAFSLIKFYGSFETALRYSSVQTASIMSTTGFSTADFTQWPPLSQLLIFVLFFIGGCSGSTGGGFKVIRWVILSKQFRVEIKRMLHPHGVFNVRVNGIPGRNDLVLNIAAFLFMYFLLVFATTVMGTIGGLDLFEALTGSLSMVGNVGPGWGRLTGNMGFLPDWLKCWYCFAMIAGRLELYNLIIFFTRDFWKK